MSTTGTRLPSTILGKSSEVDHPPVRFSNGPRAQKKAHVWLGAWTCADLKLLQWLLAAARSSQGLPPWPYVLARTTPNIVSAIMLDMELSINGGVPLNYSKSSILKGFSMK